MRGIKKNKNKVGKHVTHLTPYPHPTRQSILLLLRKAVMSKAKCFINSRPRAIQPSQKKKKIQIRKKTLDLMISIQHVETQKSIILSLSFSHLSIKSEFELLLVEACENTGTCKQLEARTASVFPWAFS